MTFHRIKEGYQEVPLGLARRFEEQGGELQLGVRARSVDSVVLDDGTTGVRLEVCDATSGAVRMVLARAAILAMPRRSLELLEPTGAVLGNARFQNLLTTVTPIPLFNAFAAYHEVWWERAGVSSGRSVTDLPLRQVYYWAPPEPGGNSVLLATYDDTLNVAFWQDLAHDPERYGLHLDHLPAARRAEIAADPGDSRWAAHRAPAALAREAHRQLVEMHGISDAPAPYAAMYHDWSADPYGGGVNLWNIGAKSWEVIPRMVAPVDGVPVFICGGILRRPGLGRGRAPDRRAGLDRSPWPRPGSGEACPSRTGMSAGWRAAILGTGSCLPDLIRYNDDPVFDWLRHHHPLGSEQFQGYRQRRVLAEGQTVIDLMVPAAQRALTAAGRTIDEVDLLLGYASVSQWATPNDLAHVAARLGLPPHAAVVPINGEFANFNQGLVLADALLSLGRATCALIVVGGSWTRYVDYHTAPRCPPVTVREPQS